MGSPLRLPRDPQTSEVSPISETWLLAAITLVAAALRFWKLDQLPPGLFHDEAFNGLDVLRVLAGWHPIYFPGNFGREPLYLYLVAASVGMLGRTPGAIRVVSAILGTLTIPAAYLAARELFNRRIGLLTAAIAAVTLWHVALSRVGFRAISLPLVASLAIWQGALAWRTHRIRHSILAGALTGLTFYTYLSARFIPIALAPFAMGYLLTTKTPRHKGFSKRVPSSLSDFYRSIGIGLLAALIVSLPLGIYALNHADEIILRAGQVSVFSPQISGGHPWQLLARQTFDTLTMFFWRGDANPRHNVPLRPVFDPAMAVFFLIGLATCLWRVIASLAAPFALQRRETEGEGQCAFILIWTFVMLLPSIVAENAPSFLRAVGALPIAFIIPAIGLDTAWMWLSTRWGKLSGVILCSMALLATLVTTTATYFGSYSTSRELREAFDAAPVEMAVEVNRWLGSGWPGHGLVAQAGSADRGHPVWIDERLWNFSIAAPFLVTESPTQSAHLRFTSSAPIPTDATAVKLIVQPTDTQNALSLLPGGWRIQARLGSTVGGVPGQAPFLLYVSFEAEPARDVETLARFGSEIELVSQEARFTAPGKLVLHTEWRATQSIREDWTIFVHLVREGQVVAQNDGIPGDGLLPTSRWRAGDVIVDERELAGPFTVGRDEVRLGLYRPDTGARLAVYDATGRLTGLDYWLITPVR